MFALTLGIMTTAFTTFFFFCSLAVIAVQGQQKEGEGVSALIAFLFSLTMLVLFIVASDTLPYTNAPPTFEMCIKSVFGVN